MLRGILYAIISIFAITFIRMVVGIITKGFSDLMKEETASSRTSASSAGQPGQRPSMPTGGELKACKKCGTYVVASRALTGKAGGETVYFCSEECKQKVAAG